MPRKIEVLAREVRLSGVNEQDYVCLTDIARYKNADASDDLIRNWLRNRNTLEFLGLWEQINNPGFNPVEFDGIKKVAGLNSFTLTPKQWIERTGAIGIESKAGRYGGTYAHLVCLSNLENLNALFIGQALPQSERLSRLNQIAIQQMKLLIADERMPLLPEGKKGQ
ncbi:MAG: KilA-N domain-containing protein [Burkholderiales bacterium]|jgi:hypothetical protein|nr:KilA-N domain-containing protein [Burkholderiales bacterium]